MEKRSSSNGQQRKPARTAMCRVQREKRRKEGVEERRRLAARQSRSPFSSSSLLHIEVPTGFRQSRQCNGAFVPAITARSLKSTSGLQKCFKIDI
jgi:hypothetical protein